MLKTLRHFLVDPVENHRVSSDSVIAKLDRSVKSPNHLVEEAAGLVVQLDLLEMISVSFIKVLSHFESGKSRFQL